MSAFSATGISLSAWWVTPKTVSSSSSLPTCYYILFAGSHGYDFLIEGLRDSDAENPQEGDLDDHKMGNSQKQPKKVGHRK